MRGQITWQVIALLIAITFLVIMIVFIMSTRGDMLNVAKDLGSAISI